MNHRHPLGVLGRQLFRIIGMLALVAILVAAVSAVLSFFPESVQMYEWFITALMVLLVVEIARCCWRRFQMRIPPPEPPNDAAPRASAGPDEGPGGAGVPARLPGGPKRPLLGAAAKELPEAAEEVLK